MEHTRYDHQKARSDTSGWDIHAHAGDFSAAVRHVRSWLMAQANARNVGTSRILGKYSDFQAWYWERELAAGSTDDDIRSYPTIEVVSAMRDWMGLGQPITL